MAGLDLTGVQEFVEGLMVDTCTILRDAEREGDDYWNEDDGVYVRPVGDDATIYSGACFSSYTGTDTYWVFLPVDAPEVRVRDRVVYGDSEDARLSGKTFYVLEQVMGTYQATRRLRISMHPVPS